MKSNVQLEQGKVGKEVVLLASELDLQVVFEQMRVAGVVTVYRVDELLNVVGAHDTQANGARWQMGKGDWRERSTSGGLVKKI